MREEPIPAEGVGAAAHKEIELKLTGDPQYAAEVEKLDGLLAAGAIDQQTYSRAVEDANDRALRSSAVASAERRLAREASRSDARWLTGRALLDVNLDLDRMLIVDAPEPAERLL